MPAIGNLLDHETLQALQTVVLADLEAEAPAKATDETTDEATGGYVVIKAATEPNPPKPLRPSDYIDIDPRGEAMFDTQCVDCKAHILVDPQVPEGVDPEAPRVPICADCAKVRVRHMAMTEQRRIETVRRRATTKPTTTSTTTTNTKESTPMPNTTDKQIDLDNLTDAELGAAMRQQLKAMKVEQIEAAEPKVKAERKKKAKKDKAGIKAEQERRHNHILTGFAVSTTLSVPDLDLSDVPSLDESPSAATRSPYNKARFRLATEAPLDPETTTYAFLAAEHERLRGLAFHAALVRQDKEAKPAKTEAETVTETVVLAVTDVDAKAKALAKVLGVSKKAAKAIVLANA